LDEIYELNNDDVIKCIEKAAVVIYGEYVDEYNDNYTPLVASSNQVMEIYNPKLKNKYMDYIKNGRTIENFYYNNNLISVGIHNTRRRRDENTEIQSSNESYIDDYNHYYICFFDSVIINGWFGKTAFIR